ncbi:olfactory receptor 2AT4-like [Melanotaenia boesemani]|uniref:olfactory receptor 2AT4-like n=1 Tax=Melanotaenia boesemani TaxID=1250792 RepID=UPI001C0427A6|nr:olfactory receptor 2AT4-like [Melanotaenia boesemani]
MDRVSNETYLTFGGHVELYNYRFLYFVIMFGIYILIICSNSVILFLIWIKKNLHEPMYMFIAALLLNSILFSTNVYPKLLIDFLSDKQIVSHSLCSFQGFIYYSLCGSELFLLAAMGYDRYVCICKPLQYSTIMNRRTVTSLLVSAWLLPACQLVPSLVLTSSLEICMFTLKGIYCNNSISQIYCMKPRAAYIIYGTFIFINTTFLPILFIIFTYAKILIVSYQSSINFRVRAIQTCSPHLLVLISFSCFYSYDVVIARMEVDLDKTVRFIMSLQVILYHPLFNPIIYGLKLKKISEHLKGIFARGKLTVCVRINVC